MKLFITLITASILLLSQPVSANFAVESLLDVYRYTGAGPFSADAGQYMWTEIHNNAQIPIERRCSSCHTNNLNNTGKHIKTKKLIKAMAPTVNAKRLTDTKKIEKWFMRNCKWTLGRECSAQEKGDFLLYIQKSGV